MKTLPIDLKKLSDAVSKEVLKNTKFITLYTKVNNLENKIPDVSTLIHTKHRETKFGEQIEEGKKKIPDISGLVTTVVLNTKIVVVENKIPGISGLMTTAVLYTKIGEAENKIRG